MIRRCGQCLCVGLRRSYAFLARHIIIHVIAINCYVLTFTVLMPLVCDDWAYSKFYTATPKDVMEKATSLNQQRAEDANRHLEGLDRNLTYQMYDEMRYEKGQVDLAIGVVTIKRSHPQYRLDYLTQVLARMDTLIKTDTNFGNKVLFICNAEPHPEEHKEAKRLAKYFPTYSRFHDFNNSVSTAKNMDMFEKEKEDYLYCMSKALQHQPKYVFIIEDDVVPHWDTFDVLKYLLSNTLTYKYSSGDHAHKTGRWAYLKMYYPEKWQGYAFETTRITELISVGVLGGTLSVLLLFVISCCLKLNTRQPYSFVFLLGFVYLLLVAWLLGRQYLVSLRHISTYTHTVVPAPDCCTQAIVYEREMAEEIATYLNQIKCNIRFPIDLAMDKYANDNGYRRCLVEPNLVNHIGMFSTIKNRDKKPEHFLFKDR